MLIHSHSVSGMQSRWRKKILLPCIAFLVTAIILTGNSSDDSDLAVVNIAEVSNETRYFVHNTTDEDQPLLEDQPLQEQQKAKASNKKKLPCEHNMKYHRIWEWAANAITAEQLYPEAPEVDEVLKAMQTARIVYVDVLDVGKYESGTAEKWVVVLEGGQKTMMKIVWDTKGQGKPEARCNDGFEMPTAEIAAFGLHRALGFRNSPYVTGRKVDLLREILPVASPAVAKNIVTQDKQTCVLGRCYFCKHLHSLCLEDGIVEASLSYWVPRHLKLHTAPPRYKPYSLSNMKEFGQFGFNNRSYCDWTKRNHPPYEIPKYYHDLFDFAVIDTIMYHFDSKHYTVDDNSSEQDLVVKLDHGRSFCSNERDDEHIFLAPVTQCCTLRNTTWQKLQAVKGGTVLSQKLRHEVDKDPIFPILEEKWYPVIERRLKIVTDMVERCAEANGWENVLV